MVTTKNVLLFLVYFSFSLSDPIPNIHSSLLAITTKEYSNSKSSFNKIIGMLNELEDNTIQTLIGLSDEEKSTKFRCSIEANSLEQDAEQLDKKRYIMINNLKEIQNKSKYYDRIKKLKKLIEIEKRKKYIYKKTFELVKQKYDKIRNLTIKILPKIDCSIQNFNDSHSKLINHYDIYSINKSKRKAEDCYKEFTFFFNQISILDDTSNCNYKSKLIKYLRLGNPFNMKTFDYAVIIQSIKRIKQIIISMNREFKLRFDRYKNSPKISFSFDSNINSMRNLIRNYRYHLKFNEENSETTKELIASTEETIKKLDSAHKSLKRDCNNSIVFLQLKGERLTEQLQSYKKLKRFFIEKYSYLSKSTKEKYDD